jgi:hypothetical protein
MSLIVLLDAGPLGMVTNPTSSPKIEACKNWLEVLAGPISWGSSPPLCK